MKLEMKTKIKGLTKENISFYCDCKLIKILDDCINVDFEVELCPIHEDKYERQKREGLFGKETFIPEVHISY